MLKGVKYTVKDYYCSEKTMFSPKSGNLKGHPLKDDPLKIHSKRLLLLGKNDVFS
jgi:hypothetical protein